MARGRPSNGLGAGPLLLALLLPLVACAGDDSDEPVSDFEIEGRVVDDLDGDPISGAEVIFVSDTLDETTTRTDGDGHYFMVTTVRVGVSYGTLHAEHPSFRDGAEQTVYFDGTTRTVDLQLRRAGD
jgi:hypothetical protein